MLPDKKVKCHHTGFRISCYKGVTEHCCPKWIHIIGKDPQSDATFDKYGCSDTYMHMLLIENSQMQRQTGAAVESMRNEIVARMDSQIGMTLESVLPRKAIK